MAMSFADLPAHLAGAMQHFSLSGVAGQTAWLREDALRVIDWLSAEGFAVVGGDMVVIKDDQPVYTYENWSTPWNPRLSWQAYVAEANRRAVEAIRRYPETDGCPYYYVLACAASSSDLLMGRWLS